MPRRVPAARDSVANSSNDGANSGSWRETTARSEREPVADSAGLRMAIPGTSCRIVPSASVQSGRWVAARWEMPRNPAVVVHRPGPANPESPASVPPQTISIRPGAHTGPACWSGSSPASG